MSDDVLAAIAYAIALDAEAGEPVRGRMLVGDHGPLFDEWGVEPDVYGPDRSWAYRSACKDVTTEQSLWFWPDDEGNVWEAANAAEAESVFCRECPVRLECYNYAIAIKAEQGVWGGVDFGHVKMEKMREARRRTAARKETT